MSTVTNASPMSSEQLQYCYLSVDIHNCKSELCSFILTMMLNKDIKDIKEL